ncbi:MAG: OsmC family protein [Candidatus Bathyarchaeia archaeon]
MSEEKTFSVELELLRNYEFRVGFNLEGVGDLIMDEPPPGGEGKGPNASSLILAAVGNCLSASLSFCLRRSRVEVKGMKTEVEGTIARNEEGRWRIKEIKARLHPEVDEGQRNQLERCIEIFEQYCIATQSIRKGVDVDVEVVK